MADVPEPPRPPLGLLPTVGDLEFSEDRQAFLRPKLDALLDELRKIEDLERPEREPAAAGSWERDADARR